MRPNPLVPSRQTRCGLGKDVVAVQALAGAIWWCMSLSCFPTRCSVYLQSLAVLLSPCVKVFCCSSCQVGKYRPSTSLQYCTIPFSRNLHRTKKLHYTIHQPYHSCPSSRARYSRLAFTASKPTEIDSIRPSQQRRKEQI